MARFETSAQLGRNGQLCQRSMGRANATKLGTGLPMTLPTHAVLSQNGRRYKVRVLDYQRGLFRVLARDSQGRDTVRFAPRGRLTFLP